MFYFAASGLHTLRFYNTVKKQITLLFLIIPVEIYFSTFHETKVSFYSILFFSLHLPLSITPSVRLLLGSSIIQRFTFSTSPLLLPSALNLVSDFIVLEIRFAAKHATQYRQ